MARSFARATPRQLTPVHAAQRSEAAPDRWLFAAVAMLVGIGLVMVFSASSATSAANGQDPAYYLKRQFVWLVIATFCAYVAYRIDYHRLKRWAPAIAALTTLLLFAVLVPHVGAMAGGARRWIGAGFISFQPSEFAKLALVLYLAAVLAARGERVRSLWRGIVPLAAVTSLMIVAVLKEPDVGTASLLGFTTLVLLFVAGARLSHLFALCFVVLPPVLLLIFSSGYKRARILAFLDPWKDPQNTGFHIVQSLFALGSGGLLGVGLGASRQKFSYLPAQYTDFIFAILGEEWGLLGACIVVALFLIFAYRAVKIALAAPDRFGFLLAIGCTSTIVIQAFINIGVVTSSWPVTGVPLPFVSFGGSSLVVSLIAVGLILNVGRHARTARS